MWLRHKSFLFWGLFLPFWVIYGVESIYVICLIKIHQKLEARSYISHFSPILCPIFMIWNGRYMFSRSRKTSTHFFLWKWWMHLRITGCSCFWWHWWPIKNHWTCCSFCHRHWIWLVQVVVWKGIVFLFSLASFKASSSLGRGEITLIGNFRKCSLE